MKTIKVKPQEISDILVNPGMGWTTYSSFNGDEINQNYPLSSIAYFRFYWGDLEPEEGKYQWDIIDNLLQIGRQRGQRLALRIASANGWEKIDMEETMGWHRYQGSPLLDFASKKRFKVPEWFYKISKGGEYYDKRWPSGTHPAWEPDYSSPQYLEKHGKFILAFGNRYNGHPDIDYMDIGSVGRWGEWHTVGVPMPPFEAKKKIIDIYLQAFSKTPLLMLIGDEESLAYAVSKGAGWRADCLGDMSEGWNHMEDCYPQRIVGAKATKVWKTAPVAFETCWTIQHWKEKGWSIEYIYDFALAAHVSVLNNKSSPIPQDWWPEVNDFSCKMGYRLVLKEVEHPESVNRDRAFLISMLWENKGVAPCYHKFALAFRLRNAQCGKEYISVAKIDIRKWLPGSHKVEEKINIPKNFSKGYSTLSIGIINTENKKPVVKLAIKSRDKNGWYPISSFNIKE